MKYNNIQMAILMVSCIIFITPKVRTQCLSFGQYEATDSECYDCGSVSPGCLTCKITPEVMLAEPPQEAFFECTSCQFGYYLFKEFYANRHKLSYCIEDCSLLHPEYVNNPIDMVCQYCGKLCKTCNLKEGCTQTTGFTHGYINAVGVYESSLSEYPYEDLSSMFYSSTFSVNHPCLVKDCAKCTIEGVLHCEMCKYDLLLSPDKQECSTNCLPRPEECISCIVGEVDKCNICNKGYGLKNPNAPMEDCEECEVSGCEECYVNYEICTRCESGKELKEKPWGGFECKEKMGYEAFSADCTRESVNCEVCASRFAVDNFGRTDCNFGTVGYPVQEYDPFDSTFLTKRQLKSCGSICGEGKESCVKYNPSTTKCKTCGDNKYLQITEGGDRTGDCIAIGSTSNTHKLYVRPAPLVTEGNIQSAGTLVLPFNDLEQALTKAMELGADKRDQTVEIVMGKGPHYQKKNRIIYLPSKVNTWDNSVGITIKPNYCADEVLPNCAAPDEKVEIINKRGASFSTNVYGSLTWMNINMDSIDSIMVNDDDCLNADHQCCEFDTVNNEIIKADPTYTYNCSIHKPSGGDCPYNLGLPLFQLTQKTPPSLIKFLDSSFTNFLFNFRTFVALKDEEYGEIIFANTEFRRFLSCGGLINNYPTPYAHDVLVVDNNIPPDYNQSTENIDAFKSANEHLHPSPTRQDTLICPEGTGICLDISINNCTFDYMRYGEATAMSYTYVKGGTAYSYFARYSIINIWGPLGSIDIRNSTFTNNHVNLKVCLNEFGENSDIYGKRRVVQGQGLIFISTKYKVYLFGNTFERNSGIYAPIKILRPNIYNDPPPPDPKHAIVIYKNSFKNNFGFIQAGVLAIDIISAELGIEPHANPYGHFDSLGGVHLEENTFENNIGCNKVPGAVAITQTSGVQTDPRSSEVLAPLENWDNIYTNLVYMKSNEYNAKSPEVGDVPSYEGVDLSLDLNIIKFKGNIWQRNYASTAPIIKLLFGRYNLQNETFLQNGNTFNETFALLGFGFIFEELPIPDITTLLGDNPNSANRHLQHQGVIYANQVYELIITNSTFDQNWAYDIKGGDQRTVTATDLYVHYPGGSLLIDDNIFQNHKGMEAVILDDLYSIDYTTIVSDSRLHGQGTPMIAITGESTSIVLSENQYLNNMGSEVEGLFFTNTDGNKRIKDPSYITVENMNITTFSNREEKVYTPSLDLTQLASLFQLTGSIISIAHLDISGNGIVDTNYWNGVIIHLELQVKGGSRNPDTATFSDINITNNEALGGLLYTEDMKNLTMPNPPSEIPADNYYHIDISGLQVIGCTNCGSLAINIGDYVHMNIHDNYIYNNKFSSSCLQLDGKRSSLNIERNNITELLPSVKGYSFLRSDDKNVTIKIKNNYLTCFETAQTNIYDNIATDNGATANTYKGAMYIYDGTVEVHTNVYRNCYYGNGSIYQTEASVNFTEESGDYQYLGAASGLLFLAGQATLKEITIQYCRAQSGMIILNTQNGFVADKLTVQHNIAMENTFLEAVGAFTINIKDSQIKNNTALVEVSMFTGIELADGSIITNTLFYYNSAPETGIFLMNSYFTFDGCKFKNNTANSKSPNIFSSMSLITIKDTEFNNDNSPPSLSDIEEIEIQGHYILAQSGSKITINDTDFSNGYAFRGGAIAATGLSSLVISGSGFENMIAGKQGGAIYCQNIRNLSIAQTGFSNIKSAFYGDALYIYEADLIDLSNISFEGFFHNAIYLQATPFLLNNATFSNQNLGNSTPFYGGAINGLKMESINISESIFQNVTSEKGTIYIYSASEPSYITNVTFKSNIATDGGGLYLESLSNVTISTGSFYNNTAEQKGGGIYFGCVEYYTKNLECKLNITSVLFDSNKGKVLGGAIHWEDLEPILADSNEFVNNTSNSYGDDISCFPQKLVKMTSLGYVRYQAILSLQALSKNESTNSSDNASTSTSTNNRGRELSFQIADADVDSDTTYNVTTFQSGGIFAEFVFALVDKYNQIITSDSDRYNKYSYINISKINLIASTTTELSYSPKINTLSTFQASSGVFIIANMSFTSQPGSSPGIELQTSAIDYTKPSNAIFLQELQNKTNSTNSMSFLIRVEVRECNPGELFDALGNCVACGANMYTLSTMTEPGYCLPCDTDVSYCYGGSNIGPKAGYWRRSNTTDEFIKCLNQEACLGMQTSQSDPQGECLSGYQNTICADCAVDYSRTGDFDCSPCPTTASNSIRLAVIFILVAVFVFFMVKSTIESAIKKKAVHSVYLRIMMNHLQMIVLTASFNLDWPQLVIDFFNSITPITNASKQLLSFDCFLDSRDPEDTNPSAEGDGLRVTYIKLIMVEALPAIMTLVAILIWLLVACHRRTMEKVWSRVITTVIVLLFLAHPTIVQLNFDLLNCYDIGEGDVRLLKDLEIVCWEGSHMIWVGFVVIPFIIIWALGIPCLAFFLIRRVKSNLDDADTKEKYGFIYNGYRKEKYFWELIIMYRKITFIFIAVFLRESGILVQGLVVMVFALFCLAATYQLHPFMTIILNTMESYSLLTCAITIYCGLCFVSARQDDAFNLTETWKWIFFLIIVGVNLVFVTYWMFQMFKAVRTIMLKASEKIFVVFCLCCKKRDLDQQKTVMYMQDSYVSFYEALRLYSKKVYKEYDSSKLPELNEEKLEEIEAYMNSLKGRSELYFMKDYKDVHNQVEANREVRENEEETAKLAMMANAGIAVGNLKAVRKQKVGPEIQIDNMDESNLLGLTQAENEREQDLEMRERILNERAVIKKTGDMDDDNLGIVRSYTMQMIQPPKKGGIRQHQTQLKDEGDITERELLGDIEIDSPHILKPKSKELPQLQPKNKQKMLSMAEEILKRVEVSEAIEEIEKEIGNSPKLIRSRLPTPESGDKLSDASMLSLPMESGQEELLVLGVGDSSGKGGNRGGKSGHSSTKSNKSTTKSATKSKFAGGELPMLEMSKEDLDEIIGVKGVTRMNRKGTIKLDQKVPQVGENFKLHIQDMQNICHEESKEEEESEGVGESDGLEGEESKGESKGESEGESKEESIPGEMGLGTGATWD